MEKVGVEEGQESANGKARTVREPEAVKKVEAEVDVAEEVEVEVEARNEAQGLLVTLMSEVVFLRGRRKIYGTEIWQAEGAICYLLRFLFHAKTIK